MITIHDLLILRWGGVDGAALREHQAHPYDLLLHQ